MLRIGCIAHLNETKTRYTISSKLVDRIIEAGHQPIVFYPQSEFKEIDALILSGGDDIHPSRYHQTLDEHAQLENELIENYEFNCLSIADKMQIPILGICRGMQVIAVYYGGSINQHIEHHLKTTHGLQLSPFSSLKGIQNVNSFHHQALLEVPFGFRLSGLSGEIIECIENDLCLAVQWHPELMDNDIVLPTFFEKVLSHKIKQDQNR